MVSSVREMGTVAEIPMCCEKSMEKSGFAYEHGEGWWDRYLCPICGSSKLVKKFEVEM